MKKDHTLSSSGGENKYPETEAEIQSVEKRQGSRSEQVEDEEVDSKKKFDQLKKGLPIRVSQIYRKTHRTFSTKKSDSRNSIMLSKR